MIRPRMVHFEVTGDNHHLGNGRVFREPRTEWLQLEPGDSPLALTRPVGLKVDDHFFTSYTAQQRDSRSSVGGQEHMEHIEHVFSYIIPGARSSWSFGIAAFLQSFHKSMCSMCSVCSHRENSQTWCVPSSVPMCRATETGDYFTSLLRHLRLL